jgi:hypothetical protein
MWRSKQVEIFSTFARHDYPRIFRRHGRMRAELGAGDIKGAKAVFNEYS